MTARPSALPDRSDDRGDDRNDLVAALRRQAVFRSGLIELVARSLQRGLDEGFYQHLLERAVEVIPGAQAGSILRRVEGSDRFRFVAAVGYDLDTLRDTYLLEGEMHRPSTGQAVLVRDFPRLDRGVVPPERLEPMYAAGPTEAIEVALSVPVLLDGRPAAYLLLDNFDDGDAFGDEAIEMAQVFAQQVAALLHRFGLEHDLERLAYFDPVTELPNRRLLRKRLEEALARARRTGEDVALLFVDLDNFKQLNDLHGHDFGDRVLLEITGRIRGRLRESDVLARWGGDEFIVLLPSVAGPESAADLASRLLDLFRDPLVIDGQEARATLSIGVDLDRPGARRSADELIHNADTALGRAKSGGRDVFRFYTEEMNARIEARRRLETRLRLALRERVIEPHFQPRIDLATGRVTAVEALARWWDDGAFVPPARFVPLAEETGLIHALGLQMLDRSVAQARAWLDAGRSVRVAVNVSGRQLHQPDFVGTVAEALVRHELPAALLELELSEGAVMDDVESSLVRLGALRELGVSLAIDDFGTSYSSLAFLHRLPVQFLKIDRVFVERLGADGPDPGLPVVRAIAALAKTLGFGVVAEGVETEAQLATLRELGCDEAQGHLFGRPVAAAEVPLDRPA